MAEIYLHTPLTEADVRKLRLEDTVFINGHSYGIRDATQIRIFDEGVPPPTDLTGAVCLHTAPGVKKLPDGRYEKICIGTTTSTRMNRFYPGLIKDYGVRAMIGKGGFLQDTVDAMKEYGGVYLAIVGGAAALEQPAAMREADLLDRHADVLVPVDRIAQVPAVHAHVAVFVQRGAVIEVRVDLHAVRLAYVVF